MPRNSGQTIMRNTYRISLGALLLAGGTLFAAVPCLAEDTVVHHPAAHPRPAVRPAPFRGVRFGARFGRPAFHPLHAAIFAHRSFARFTPAERLAWTHGRWFHRSWHGRFGWWWNAGGVWFWYDAPVYPYPTVVSDNYYEEPDYDQAAPAWYYCYNPPGYYPYVPVCRGQWRPVAAAMPEGYGNDQGGPDQGPPPGASHGMNNEEGPPPSEGPGDEQGPPPGYEQGPPGNEQGPPPGYYQGPSGDEQGPPPGYYQGPPGYEQGPPPGYNQGPPGGDQGPPSGYDQGPPPGYDQGSPPGDDQGPPPNDDQGPPNNQQGPHD